jgi:Homeodomain-like domain-containing protein
MMRSDDEVRLVERLAATGRSQSEVARLTGIPRATVSRWVRRGAPGGKWREKAIEPADVPRAAYAYLLGLYLGDGYICRMSRTYNLRISMDARYPGIIEEARRAISDVLAPNRGSVQRFRSRNMVEIHGYSNSLPRLFPQHGPGPKHKRRIELEAWQEAIVREHPEQFLRGLIHSDGCRCTNKIQGGKYEYPRYFFSQVSRDIMWLFCRACHLVGVEHRFTSSRQISVARRASVARLDEFVDPKA